MSMIVAIQMDPMETIDITADSTFVLALEAQARGYSLYHYLPQDLVLNYGRVTAGARPLTVRREAGNHFDLGPREWIDLALADVVLMRQDPPFDMAYITATHLLEHVHPGTLVVNDPVSVRNAPEKLFVTHFPELMPPTLITSNREQIMEFRAEHGDLIIKPLFGNGGAGVFHIGPEDENLNSLLELFTELFREPIIVQRYEAAVRAGDKRIILIDGKPAGAVNRVPAAGESRSNLHVGGRALKTTLTGREMEICEAIGPSLRERGMIFVGIDVIGDYMTEINVTSPTCLQEINNFDGTRLEADIWDAIESRLNSSKV
ncbi:MAG: glutathione synthase [Rhodospirillales bacterium]|jgi:glutathione synthase|nr:glutathione synthase [Rhodospirillaceae bacterium]MAF50146.1 glutathione synthase [Rhodospirillaceae bacterium]MDP6428362.1 glutathione synthase [Rhodospirillales bacterium]MDP6644371.1 glutathione synthase [Rhodospirillales bacterium]MDP6843233.1 glutathione synthase [Rhodospirillales bacterium]